MSAQHGFSYGWSHRHSLGTFGLLLRALRRAGHNIGGSLRLRPILIFLLHQGAAKHPIHVKDPHMTKPEKGDKNQEEKQSSKISYSVSLFVSLPESSWSNEEVQEGYSFPDKLDSSLSPHNSQKLIQSKKNCRVNKVWTPHLAPSSWKELSFQVTASILNQKLWEKNLSEFKRLVDRKVVEEVTNPGKEAAYMKLNLKNRAQTIDLIFARIKY